MIKKSTPTITVDISEKKTHDDFCYKKRRINIIFAFLLRFNYLIASQLDCIASATSFADFPLV